MMIFLARIIVRRHPEEHRLALAPGQDFLSPISHQALVSLGNALTDIIHHYDQLVAAASHFAEIALVPVNVAIGMPARRWRVGSNREQFPFGERGAKVLKEGKEIGVAARERLNVDLDARETRMSHQ